MSDYFVIGPPGTGKTTELAARIDRAVDHYGEEKVLVSSFSRAAAKEIAKHRPRLPKNHMGTLHSLCWHALDGPKIAEEQPKKWNEYVEERNLEDWKIAHGGRMNQDIHDDDEGPREEKQTGDELLAEINCHRSCFVDQKLWSPACQEFHTLWNEWKDKYSFRDYTDLIEDAYHHVSFAPGDPKAIFIDEAQDLTPLQVSLVRKWGNYADWTVFACDDDQTIYSHIGATPKALFDCEIPANRIKVLDQSHRIPRRVQQTAETWIRDCSFRKEKSYRPRNQEGSSRTDSDLSLKDTEAFTERLRLHALEESSAMVLAAANYQLFSLMKQLKLKGIPFHNPYAPDRMHFNPLTTEGCMAERLRALLAAHPALGARHWYMADLQRWAEPMEAAGCLKRGAKEAIKRMPPAQVITMRNLSEVFERPALVELLHMLEMPVEDLMHWWHAKLGGKFKERAAYPVRVVENFGVKALTAKPTVIAGTIHSVKGGEAATVYLSPDVSPNTYSAYGKAPRFSTSIRIGEPAELRDAVIRTIYVGMTRAREALVILRPDTFSLPLHEYV